MADTSGPPVSCANVRILLSTDGGNPYPSVLAARAPNTGSAADLKAGTYYFRLKQTDTDSATTYSPVQPATITGGFSVSCFPNTGN